MNDLSKQINIGKTLALKLENAGVSTFGQLQELGSEKAFIRLTALENSGACLNMLFALEGALQGVRWHHLDAARKTELKAFYQRVCD